MSRPYVGCMTSITEPAQVARILADPRFRVPEADAAATSPFDRFRAAASRYANGSVHEDRRVWLDARLARVSPSALADASTARTRFTLADSPDTSAVGISLVARTVPVASLAAVLGFDDADRLADLVAVIADRYATGVAIDPTAEDDAIAHLLSSAPGADAEARTLEVQLLVQVWAATASLIERTMGRLATEGHASQSTGDLLHATLEHDPPVAATRRVDPSGDLVVLRLDGADLAFGAGARPCPAPHHAIAIATAVVDELRRPVDAPEVASVASVAPPAEEGPIHVDAD